MKQTGIAFSRQETRDESNPVLPREYLVGPLSARTDNIGRFKTCVLGYKVVVKIRLWCHCQFHLFLVYPGSGKSWEFPRPNNMLGLRVVNVMRSAANGCLLRP
ncbi:hypothetical protein TNCT_529591 [Trichonephila clavata]|uniref:Uncharacterized protein n=1 Tax=Trichonephila clavata TaxID=2740835 RepID=A0A8X6LH44_TRICU|nr:hypothetical protein TNCT_529591 [Trichonephila clavata]